MTEYADYQQSRPSSLARPAEAIRRSFTRNSHLSRNSVSASTQSWVYTTQQNPPGPPPPPPQPLDLPSPVQRLRPLPNPFAPAPSQGHGPLHVVNTSEEEDLEYMNIDANGPGLEYGYKTEGLGKGKKPATPGQSAGSGPSRQPQKKKSFVGGFFKGVRRLPKTVFGYGAGMGGSEKGKLKRRGTIGTEATSTSVTGMTGSTLPRYVSNPSSPMAGPGPSGLNVQYVQAMEMPIPKPAIPGPPPPEVVRLSDTIPRAHRGYRIAPPSESTGNEDNGLIYGSNGPLPFTENPTSESSMSNNPADRTTVMIYNHDRNQQYYDRNSQVPPIVSRRLSSGPGLSYVSEEPHEEPLQPLRPASFHASMAHGPSPADVSPRMATPGPNPRVSYASQIPPRHATPLIPGEASARAPSPSQAPGSTPQPTSQPHSSTPPAEPIQSPVSARPLPADDYMKMTLSPSPTSRNTVTSGTTYSYDPSFSSELSPVERFFKTLYHMPWISHERVTVDYLPGEGVGASKAKRKKRRVKPISSWYRSMLSRSRRSSATLDLLSSGTGTETSPRTSLGAGLALALGSPASGTRRGRTSEGVKKRGRTKTHHHRYSHRRSSPHHRRHKRRRHTATTMDTADTGFTADDTKASGSPYIPAMYPFQYQPYPYTTFPTFPIAAPAAVQVASPTQSQSSPQAQAQIGDRHAAPRSPRGVYAATPAGYAAYQPMMASPQMYVLQSTSALQAQTGNPVDPGGGGGENQAQQPAQTQVVYMQNIPGAFA